MWDDIFLSFMNTWVDVNTALKPIQRLKNYTNIVQHCATSHRMFSFIYKTLESTTYYLMYKHLLVICLFDLTLNVWVNKFSVISGWVFPDWTSTMKGFTCLAQKYNAVMTVKLELATPQSRVKQSTTEPLRPSDIHCYSLSEFKATSNWTRKQFDTVY